MKKLTVLVLCFAFIISLVPAVGVSASSEGKAINSASDFYKMSSTGTYYLNADIKIDRTYDIPFNGTLDGNGHTVTIISPMFADFSGEVKNLNIKGDIYYMDANAAAFAVVSSKGFNATNCVNNANVTVVGNAKLASGFVTECYYNESPMVFKNCINNGNIYVDSTADEKPRAGGFGAIIDSVILNNCENHGDIYVKGNIGIAGGLVARAALNSGGYTVEAFNCLNTGNILVEDTYIGKDGVSPGTGGAEAGGLFGYVGIRGNFAWYRIWGCRNDGKIDAPYRVGGLVAYVYGNKSDQFVDIQFCINTGDIVYGRTKKKNNDTDIWDYAGPFVAYTNSDFTTIKYNIDTGSVIRRKGTVSSNEDLSFVNLSSGEATWYDLKCNYLLNYSSYKYYSFASSPTNSYNIHLISETDGILPVTLSDIKSGEICYIINETASNDGNGYAEGFAFYQNIGKDEYPTTNPSHGKVYYTGGKYTNKVCDHRTAERYENEFDSTCTKTGGYTLVKYCSKCYEVFSKTEKTIPAKGHTPGPAATETSPQVCTTCNVILVPKKEHTHSWSTSWTIDADNHWQSCTKCSAINYISKHSYDNACDTDCNICYATRSFPGHDFYEWDVVIPPDEYSEGLRARACRNCGDTETEVIPKLEVVDTGSKDKPVDSDEVTKENDESKETSDQDDIVMLDQAIGCTSFVPWTSVMLVLAAGVFVFKKNK